MVLNRTTVGYALIVTVGLGVALAVRLQANSEFATAREHYVQESHADAMSAVRLAYLAGNSSVAAA
jgi:hypothetical protein